MHARELQCSNSVKIFLTGFKQIGQQGPSGAIDRRINAAHCLGGSFGQPMHI